MPEDEKKPAEPASSAKRAGDDDTTGQPYQTAADMLDVKPAEGVRDPRLSQSPGLTAIDGSVVPGYGDGSPVNHVQGPGQMPVDPIAAGLDMQYDPKIRHELRAPTQTGEIGAGIRPSTYLEKPGGREVKQSTEATNETVKPIVVAPAAPKPEDVPETAKQPDPPVKADDAPPAKPEP